MVPSSIIRPSSLGSFDVIRVYLWAGMLDPVTPGRDAILKTLGGMARYLHTNSVPPSKVRPDGKVEDPKGPLGFSAALLPYLSALGEKNLADEQMSRVRSELNSRTGLYGTPSRYYDQNLLLFALGAMQRRFWFDSKGNHPFQLELGADQGFVDCVAQVNIADIKVALDL
jgi:endo-1,4-beta-D-glucanase Y